MRGWKVALAFSSSANSSYCVYQMNRTLPFSPAVALATYRAFFGFRFSVWSAHCLFQKRPFILMYEERFVDVASYVCHILDQIPASPVSPMYVDWRGRVKRSSRLSHATLDTLALRVTPLRPFIYTFQRTASKLPGAIRKNINKRRKIKTMIILWSSLPSKRQKKKTKQKTLKTYYLSNAMLLLCEEKKSI